MRPEQVIVFATPVFFALIGIEYLVGRWRGRDTYRLSDAMSSIGLGMLSQVVGIGTKLFTLGIYVWVYEHAALVRLPDDSVWVWIVGLLLYDFLYYWYHRYGHEVALLWAAHAVHHQSEDYNLSTALRQTSSGWLVGWIFYLPMALLGFSPLVFAVVALIDLLYQYWVHTQQIGRLGWFDRWFCSPSNHRVHHAVNDIYLDKNYGGILILWDRLFGTFQDELDNVPCVYGTKEPLRSWNPWTANTAVYVALWRKMRQARGWREKLATWFASAGWQPASATAPSAEPGEVEDVSSRRPYDPSPGRTHLALATVLFVALLGATSLVLWWAHALGLIGWLIATTGITLGLVGVARLCAGTQQAV